jgi:hypothetical protein
MTLAQAGIRISFRYGFSDRLDSTLWGEEGGGFRKEWRCGAPNETLTYLEMESNRPPDRTLLACFCLGSFRTISRTLVTCENLLTKITQKVGMSPLIMCSLPSGPRAVLANGHVVGGIT